MIRYLSLFSGIGAFEKALDNLGIPYELLAYCEVDKYASKAYSLLHHVPVIRHDSNHPGHIADRGGTCPTLLSRDYKDPKVVICP